MNISIVMPLFNKEREIERAIDSVLKQTRREFELIIINDGSTDNSAEKAKRFGDRRIKLVHQPNAGVAAARNRGIEKSTNEYIAFLDADDAWKPDFLEIIDRLIGNFPEAGVYATAWEGVGRNGKTIANRFFSIPSPPWEGLLPSYFRAALEGEPVWTSAVVVPKSVLAEVGNFPEGISMGEDKDVWERIALKYRIAYSSQIGATYYLNSNNRLCDKYFDDIQKGKCDLFSAIDLRRSFFKKAQEAVAQNEVAPDILPDLLEYMNKYKIISAEIYLKYGQKSDRARKILKCTFPKSKPLQRKKILLYAMSRIPLQLIRFALNISKSFGKVL
jgi:glycosyltransferase involved in cell wall biosynthesis